jgi:hypothetical protein
MKQLYDFSMILSSSMVEMVSKVLYSLLVAGLIDL